jgi:hypothetical protein
MRLARILPKDGDRRQGVGGGEGGETGESFLDNKVSIVHFAACDSNAAR